MKKFRRRGRVITSFLIVSHILEILENLSFLHDYNDYRAIFASFIFDSISSRFDEAAGVRFIFVR